MAEGRSMEWVKSVKGVILDMCGVLYDSGEGGGKPIPGSVEAVERLMGSGLIVRFCTNETQNTREKFVQKLQRMGFNITVSHVFSPAPALLRILRERGLQPHLLVHDDLMAEFDGVEMTSPNCVVIGDAAERFSYQNLNEAFGVLIGLEKPILFSLGQGPSDEHHPSVKADAHTDDLAAAVDALLISDL
ncbi:Phospholysine phosphohistidine inorganic pyrophosphate phosphatase [Triplophysa tibetana]|uniref:Phospholysine phosphohistidine inorganic pyrophosphate phosphatase n=1 Tax=Triplophysa tibetana TaxID=1572043 RepID=A0A5A9PRA8_9TELE|nr:Phospholysine phosphohistidine inorganic pyrophosphate phosphatase [Triplophysa tibetana]